MIKRMKTVFLLGVTLLALGIFASSPVVSARQNQRSSRIAKVNNIHFSHKFQSVMHNYHFLNSIFNCETGDGDDDFIKSPTLADKMQAGSLVIKYLGNKLPKRYRKFSYLTGSYYIWRKPKYRVGNKVLLKRKGVKRLSARLVPFKITNKQISHGDYQYYDRIKSELPKVHLTGWINEHGLQSGPPYRILIAEIKNYNAFDRYFKADHTKFESYVPKIKRLVLKTAEDVNHNQLISSADQDHINAVRPLMKKYITLSNPYYSVSMDHRIMDDAYTDNSDGTQTVGESLQYFFNKEIKEAFRGKIVNYDYSYDDNDDEVVYNRPTAKNIRNYNRLHF